MKLQIVIIFYFAVGLILLATTCSAQIFNIFEDISSAVDKLPMDDDTVAIRSLPFSFRYFGRMINAGSSFGISSNGYITFQPNGGNYFNPQNFLNPGGPNAIVAAFWNDLNPTVLRHSNTGVYLLRRGQGTRNDRLIIQWDTVPYFGHGTSLYVTAQIVIFPAYNRIDIRILDSNTVPERQPAIGFEGWNGDGHSLYLSPQAQERRGILNGLSDIIQVTHVDPFAQFSSNTTVDDDQPSKDTSS